MRGELPELRWLRTKEKDELIRKLWPLIEQVEASQKQIEEQQERIKE
jgi:hypothetical protein